MTIDKTRDQKSAMPEPPPVTVQNELRKDVLQKNIEGENPQQQLGQVLANVQPQQQIQQTAKNQIEKGYLDVQV